MANLLDIKLFQDMIYDRQIAFAINGFRRYQILFSIIEKMLNMHYSVS